MAAMKVPDSPNYSWRTEVADDARSYDIVGSTDRATDFSVVTLPMALPSSRRGPRGVAPSQTLVTAVYKGGEQFVVQGENGWRRLEELALTGESGRGRRGGPPGGPFGGPPGVGGSRTRSSRTGGRGPASGEETDPRGYSNLQNTLSRPHEEIAIIVAGATDLKAEGEVVSGVLSETAAKLLLVHAGQKDIIPLHAAGTVRLWVKGGALVKYETRLEGVLRVENSSGRREVTVNQTATTTLSEVGTTKLEVAPEAAKKLGG